MKQYISYLFSGLLFVGLWSCSYEAIVADDNSENRDSRLTVSVTDSGYNAPVGEKSATRAEEDSYLTKFTANDKIGLYAIKEGVILSGCNNIPVTCDGTHWTFPSDYYYMGKDITYYAYYPYRENPGTVYPTASDADGFFKDMVLSWTPATDQSAYEQYTAQDLMIGTGTIGNRQNDGNRPLSITLTHQMALIVMEFPSKRYRLDTDPHYTWVTEASTINFTGFTPYYLDWFTINAGSYRYIAKPGQNLTLSGNYDTKQWELTANITSGNYKTYKIDGGISEVVHTLQVGDFYMNDGSLVGKDVSLSAAQKSACLGIVYTLQDIRSDNYGLLDSKFPHGTHGLVVAKTHSGSGDRPWSEGYSASLNQWPDRPKDYGGLGNTANKQGYINTVYLMKCCPNMNVMQKLTIHRNNNSAPTSSTNWYWPSSRELEIMCQGEENVPGSVTRKNLLNSQFGKIGGTQTGSGSNRGYWSSTESGSAAWLMVFGSYKDFGSSYTAGYNYQMSKSNKYYHMRFILAF